MLAALGIAALLISIYLRAVDKKKGYGLEQPNIKPETVEATTEEIPTFTEETNTKEQ